MGSKTFTQKCRQWNLCRKAAPQSTTPESEFEGNTKTIKMPPLKDLSMSATMIFVKLVEQRLIIVMMKRSFYRSIFFYLFFFGGIFLSQHIFFFYWLYGTVQAYFIYNWTSVQIYIKWYMFYFYFYFFSTRIFLQLHIFYTVRKNNHLLRTHIIKIPYYSNCHPRQHHIASQWDDV